MRLGFKGGTAAAAALLGSSILRTEMRIRSRLRAIPRLRVTEIRVKDIGDDFQALWLRKLAEKPRLMADRSPNCLRWHFTIPGSPTTTTVLCSHHSRRLVGYAIVQHMIDPRVGKRRCLLADILVEKDDSTVIAVYSRPPYAAVAPGALRRRGKRAT
jgi:hypothetical protein